jgi:hypothetical protein
VLEISGVEEMMSNMLNTMMENEQFKSNAQVKPMMEEFFKKNLSKDNFTKMFQHISGAFPDTPVKVGSTWNHDIVMDVGIAPINMKNNYRLKKIEDGRLIIALESSVIKNEKAEPTKIGPVEMLLQMEGTQTGDIILDSKNCWMKEMALDTGKTSDLKVEIPVQLDKSVFDDSFNVHYTLGGLAYNTANDKIAFTLNRQVWSSSKGTPFAPAVSLPADVLNPNTKAWFLSDGRYAIQGAGIHVLNID